MKEKISNALKTIWKWLKSYGFVILLFMYSYASFEYSKDYVPLLFPVSFAATYYLIIKANKEK